MDSMQFTGLINVYIYKQNICRLTNLKSQWLIKIKFKFFFLKRTTLIAQEGEVRSNLIWNKMTDGDVIFKNSEPILFRGGVMNVNKEELYL